MNHLKKCVQVLMLAFACMLLTCQNSPVYAAETTAPGPVTELQTRKNINEKDGQLVWTNTLTWRGPVVKTGTKGPEGYLIYRKVGKNGGFTYLGMTVNTKWTDLTPPLSENAYYRVYAYVRDASGKIILSDSLKYVYSMPYACPSVVKAGMTAGSTAEGTKLTWQKAAYASGYLIYKQVGSKGGFAYAGKTTNKQNTWVDTDTSCEQYDFYKIYPYYINREGSQVPTMTAVPYYVFSKHSYAEASVEHPKMCTRCGRTIGAALKRKVLLIGDSRTRYLGISGVPHSNEFSYIAEGGSNVNLLQLEGSGPNRRVMANLGKFYRTAVLNTINNSTYVDIGQVVKDHQITTIIYGLGFNNLGSDNGYQQGVQYSAATMKALKEVTGCEVFFASVIGVDERVYGGVNNARIHRYNEEVRQAVSPYGIKYLDLNSELNPAGNTVDGVHLNQTLLIRMADILHKKLFP